MGKEYRGSATLCILDLITKSEESKIVGKLLKYFLVIMQVEKRKTLIFIRLQQLKTSK